MLGVITIVAIFAAVLFVAGVFTYLVILANGFSK